jgi:hypothetical protein
VTSHRSESDGTITFLLSTLYDFSSRRSIEETINCLAFDADASMKAACVNATNMRWLNSERLILTKKAAAITLETDVDVIYRRTSMSWTKKAQITFPLRHFSPLKVVK